MLCRCFQNVRPCTSSTTYGYSDLHSKNTKRQGNAAATNVKFLINFFPWLPNIRFTFLPILHSQNLGHRFSLSLSIRMFAYQYVTSTRGSCKSSIDRITLHFHFILLQLMLQHQVVPFLLIILMTHHRQSKYVIL